MRARKLTYGEGDAFAVPLRDRGYGIGVVARMNDKGVLLGYFFEQRYDEPPELADVGELNAVDNVWIAKFGDLGLISGNWPVIGQVPGWRRERWPMPSFGRREELTGRCWRVDYDDDDPNSRPRETLISPEECDRLPEDGTAGFGFVEARMTRLLEARMS